MNPIVDDLTQAFDQIAFQQRPFIFRGWLEETHTRREETYFTKLLKRKERFGKKIILAILSSETFFFFDLSGNY